MRGDSFLHRLDPRTKIFLLVVFTSSALLTVDTAVNLALFVALLALAAASGAFRHWRKMLGRVAPLIVLIVVFDSLFSHVSWGPVLFTAQVWIVRATVTPGSIVYAITIGVRFVTLIGMSILFIMTTQFEDLVAGLRKLRVPYIVALSLGLALRSITLLTADLKAIMDAQRSRGLDLDARSLLRRADGLLSLAMPAVVCLIYRSRKVSSSMHCRGYGHVGRPTLYSRLRLKAGDWMVIVCLLALVMAIAYFRGIKL
jgi:energy-coupling factor transport system permease protein